VSFAEPALAGEGVNVVLGRKGGPVETAWATALAAPRLGHSPFVAAIRPGVPVPQHPDGPACPSHGVGR